MSIIGKMARLKDRARAYEPGDTMCAADAFNLVRDAGDVATVAEDLLEALELIEGDLMGYVDRLRKDGRRMCISHDEALRRLNRARAAIAKARGE